MAKRGVKLIRDIGLVAASLIVLNAVMGAGIFGMPGKLAEQAGQYSPWLILLFGALIITVAWTFGSIASYFKTTGGPVTYASYAFGPLVGFQVGWLFYFGRAASLAANINVIFNYMAYFWDGIANDYIRTAMFIFIIVGLTFINIIGVRAAIKSLNIISIFKFLPILVLILVGLPYISPNGFLPSNFPVIDDVGTLVLLILYAFVGFESVLFTTEETKNPTKTLPRALIINVIVIAVVYFLIQMIYVNVVTESSNDVPLIALGQILMGGAGVVIVIISAIFSILGSASGIILSAPRMTYSLAEQGLLPKWFCIVHEEYRTPTNSILFLAATALFLGITGTFIYLAMASALARMMGYVICILALPVIRKQADKETLDNAVKLPGGFLIPGLALFVCFIAAYFSPLLSWIYLSGFLAIGGLLYFANYLYKKRTAD